MKTKQIIIGLALLTASTAWAQKDVTKKYIDNPDFGARFAAWVNPGRLTYNTSKSFEGKSGEVWMEKWVAKGQLLGTNAGMYQTLRDLPTGTYTLVAAAKFIDQNDASKVCKGANLFAGQEETEINACGDYCVTFTVVNGKADIGVRLENGNGNWFCIDNFRLYSCGENADSIAAEQARLTAEQDEFKAHLENPTGTATPKVTTYPFIPTGTTIALGRATITGTMKEKGFCWSETNPEPTVLDERTTETFSHNGDIYVMRGLKPATSYYVRAYAMTNGYKVGYGDVHKIVTLPAGNMTYNYDFAGDEETNARINSASAECIWMYNNLSYIPGFNLSVHYVPGAGAGGGTADCSYGGWMRVSQNVPYQQTGTILHETNHGVGVGTTGEWYNNSNLRTETSRGFWLGPMGTKMVRFFDNSETSLLNGDGTHMWPYGINGAGEDDYNPSNQCLYYANILVTHALHQDGLPSTSGVGFASPAYVFEQDDETKYYIKSNDESTGLLTGYLYATAASIKWNNISSAEAQADDNYAWYIKYDPKTRYYYFQNVGTGKMLSYATNFKLESRATATTAEKMHLMPARQETVIGSGRTQVKKTAYWVMKPNRYDSQALQATANGVTGSKIDLSDGATRQQWIFLTASEMEALDAAAIKNLQTDVKAWIENVRSTLAIAHHANTEDETVEQIDAALESVVSTIDGEKDSYTSPAQAVQAIQDMQEALLTFLSQVTPDGASDPFNLTFFLVNPNFDSNGAGWSETPGYGSSCCEFYQTNFDFNQTTAQKLPAGTYEVRVQAYQRPGTLDDIYNDYVTGGKDKANATVYVKSKTQKIKNICADATEKTMGTNSTKLNNGIYVPNNLAGAQSYFKKGYYENSVMTTTNTTATLKLGIKSTNNSAAGYWVAFDNFRLYYYGTMTNDDITPLTSLTPDEARATQLYDLTGRPALQPKRGLYIRNGKTIIVR